MEDQLSGEIQNSFAYDFIKNEVSENTESSTVSTSQKHYVMSTMAIERFYASIKEEVSPISPPAVSLLDRQDYIGFFMACGSNYIRSIRRKQEVTAVFMFESTSVELAKSFATQLRTSGQGTQESQQPTSTSKYDSVTNSLEIKILGFGLGLNQEGSGTLVANSLEEYNRVMKFAFRAMTQSGGGASEIGMVFGVEVVPWVDNVNFQVNAKLHTENIEVPLARSLMPRAYNRTNSKDRSFTNDQEHRDAFKCREPAYEIDRYGYCCELNALYDPFNGVYDPNNITERVCRPLRTLDKSVVKANMANNGEFVVRLDQILRAKLNLFSTLEQCIGEVTAIDSRFDNQILQQKATAAFDSEIFSLFSVYQMKKALSPFGGYETLTHLGYELDEFVEMYYQRCLAALFGSGGASSDSEAKYFMANPWTSHPECMHLSCMSVTQRWSRDGSGCTPGILAGRGATPYGDDTSYCALDPESEGDSEECKYSTEKLSNFFDKAVGCWNSTLPNTSNGAIDYYVNNFCMPKFRGTPLSAADFARIQIEGGTCDTSL